MICISLGNSKLIPLVNNLMPDYVELRYDMLKMMPDQFMGKVSSEIRQVATCRPGEMSEEERLILLKRAIELGSYYVDVEIESSVDYIENIFNYTKKYDTRLIISYHDFEKTPSDQDLRKIIKKSFELGADTVKIACNVRDNEDIARLLGLYSEKGSKIIIGMGEMGRITRLAAVHLGAPFTFAAASEDEKTAPGQLTYEELVSLQNILNRA